MFVGYAVTPLRAAMRMVLGVEPGFWKLLTNTFVRPAVTRRLKTPPLMLRVSNGRPGNPGTLPTEFPPMVLVTIRTPPDWMEIEFNRGLRLGMAETKFKPLSQMMLLAATVALL